MSAFRAMLAKDLRVELRTLESIPAMTLFAITTFIVFRYGLDRQSLAGSLAAGVLLATILFAAILAINRLFLAERDEGGFDAFRLSPADPASLLAAKAAAIVIYLVVLEAITVPVFAAFFLDGASGLAPLAGILVLVDMGLAVTGALISSMAANSRARDVLVPLLLLPLLIPLVVGAAKASALVLAAGGPSYDGFGKWLAVLALYDMTFAAIAYGVFEFVIED